MWVLLCAEFAPVASCCSVVSSAVPVVISGSVVRVGKVICFVLELL